MRRAPLITVPVAALAAGAIAGCGSSGSFANHARPAAPIVVTVAIRAAGVSASPTHFGAGLVQLDVANLTDASQQMTVTAAGANSPAGQTGPINPQDPAEIRVQLNPGTYSIAVADHTVKPATLVVAAARPNSQNQLLQP